MTSAAVAFAIGTTTHGRVLVSRPAGTPAGLLVGYHGYAESAEIQLARLDAIAGAADWTRVSIQGLHRFYRGRSQDVVASWMTRQDREQAIADNLAYVDAALKAVAGPDAQDGRVIHVGFSQGVAMAFRAAVRGRWPASAAMAVGGDVPPELFDDDVRFPPVLLIRGARDEWYTEAKLGADADRMRARGAEVLTRTIEAGHEWTEEVATAVNHFLLRFRS
jgi:predicted esterase